MHGLPDIVQSCTVHSAPLRCTQVIKALQYTVTDTCYFASSDALSMIKEAAARFEVLSK